MDLPRLTVGSAITAALAVGFAAALLHHAQITVEAGPTAAQLDEAYSALLGAGLGLAVGSAVTAAIVRRGSRWLAGVCASVIAYVVVLVPVFALTRADDLGFGETVGGALLIAVYPLSPLVLAGAAAGVYLGRAVVRRRGL